ncbi:MAG TPA: NAD-dependent epimerase/dehydratase family protein [Ktedonobacterales bacterium]|nr:NAD-dependent epimerase/dehydratase family protein [Ktedonobacterales bacterium]
MPEAKRVIVVGATGEIGRAISAKLLSDPVYALVVFSRDPEAARQKVPGAVDYIAWEPVETGQWAAAVDGAYAVINMAGAPSFGVRWTPAYRAFLHTNRTTILRGLVRAMEDAATRPVVFVAASAVGAYGFTSKGRQEVTEATPGDEDAYGVESRLLEGEALRAEALGVRTVLPRTGFILDRAGGGLPGLARSMRRFTGGIILAGTQYLPWIHIADEASIIMRALDDPSSVGLSTPPPPRW